MAYTKDHFNFTTVCFSDVIFKIIIINYCLCGDYSLLEADCSLLEALHSFLP